MKIFFENSKLLYWLILVSLLGIGATMPPSRIPQSGSVVFAAIGDYGVAGQPAADVANLVKSWNPDFIVTLGDNNHPDGAAYSIDQNIGQYYHDYIFRYNGKFGGGSATRRFFPVLGNHDWHQSSPNAYLNYFDLPGNERYYDFVYGPVHFFMLDSVEYEPDGFTAVSEQAKWLKKNMSASTLPFQVVVTHYPPYSSGKHGSVPFMQWQFKEWGADAVLAGHNHIYERLSVNGLTYFVNGLGGDEVGTFRSEILPESQFRYNGDFGAMRVEATDLYMKFQFYTRGNILVDEYMVSNRAPMVSSIARASTELSNSGSVDFNVNFSEPVTGVDVSDFLLTANGISGAYISNIIGGGTNYVVSVHTGAGDGSLRLDLIPNNGIVNGYAVPLVSGNFAGESYLIDRTAPAVSSIARVYPSPTNAASVDFALNFSEPVVGVDITDLSLSTTSGAYISNVMGSGAAYLVSVVTGSAEDSLRLDLIHNGSIADAIGNPLSAGFSSGESYAIDKTSPVVVSILRASHNPTNAMMVDFNVMFSESVIGVDVSDFILSAPNITGAYVASVNGSGNFYAVSVNAGGNGSSGELRLDLINTMSVVDAAGNILSAPFNAGESYTIDKSAPIVLSISRAGAALSNANSVDFNVIFSEPVTGVDASDFAFTALGVSGAFISNITGADAAYVVSVHTGMGDGTLKLDLLDNDSIANFAGTPLGMNGIGNGNFISADVYTIDKTLLFVTSIQRGSPNPIFASSADYLVNFSEPVVGVDASDFQLTVNGVSGAVVSNVSGSGAAYIVTVNTGFNNGTIRLDLVDNNSIVNAFGEMLGGTNLNDGSFTGEVYDVVKFVAVAKNFSAPVLLAPIRNPLLNTSAPAFSWLKVKDAQYYEVVIALDANFNQIVAVQILNETAFKIGIAFGDGKYYWRARAYTVNNEAGKFSAAQAFTIDTLPPAVPALIAPLNNAVLSSKFKLIWQNTGATRYEIQVDNNADFSSPEWKSLRRDASYQISSMRRGTYYWRARGKDMADNWSAWSTAFTLIVP